MDWRRNRATYALNWRPHPARVVWGCALRVHKPRTPALPPPSFLRHYFCERYFLHSSQRRRRRRSHTRSAGPKGITIFLGELAGISFLFLILAHCATNVTNFNKIPQFSRDIAKPYIRCRVYLRAGRPFHRPLASRFRFQRLASLVSSLSLPNSAARPSEQAIANADRALTKVRNLRSTQQGGLEGSTRSSPG